MNFFLFIYIIQTFLNLHLCEVTNYQEGSDNFASSITSEFLSSESDDQYTIRLLAENDNGILSIVEPDEIVGRRLSECAKNHEILHVDNVLFLPDNEELVKNYKVTNKERNTDNARIDTVNPISICSKESCNDKFSDVKGAPANTSSFRKVLHTKLPCDKGTLVMQFGVKDKINGKKLNLVVKVSINKKCKSKCCNGTKSSNITEPNKNEGTTVTKDPVVPVDLRISGSDTDNVENPPKRKLPVPVLFAGAAAGTLGLITLFSGIATKYFSSSEAAASTGDFVPTETNASDQREIYQNVDLEMFT